MKIAFPALVLALAAAGPRAPAAEAPLPLDPEGTRIVVPSRSPDPLETQAAVLLQEWLRRACGDARGFELVTEEKAGAAPARATLAVGRTKAAGAVDAEALGPDGFRLTRKGDVVAVAGGSPRGTFLGAVALLGRVGVRFYMPGDLFTSLPRDRKAVFSGGDATETPFVRVASMTGLGAVPGDADWALRNGVNTRTGLAGTHQHNMWSVFPPERYAARFPGIYPTIGGARIVPKDPSDQKWQPCFTEPALLGAAEESAVDYFRKSPQHLWLAFSIQDSSVVCECARCAAAYAPFREKDPKGGLLTAYSHVYWGFLNALAARLETKLPGKLLVGLGYAMTREPPPFKLHPNVLVFTNFHVAELDADRILAPDASGKTPADRWLDVATHYGNHDWYQGMGYLVPRSYSGYWSRFLRHIRGRAPVTYQHAEAYPNWGLDGPKLWILARLWRNPEADVEALWAQLCGDLFGPAAAPMREYFETLEELWVLLDNVEGPERKIGGWGTQFRTTEKSLALVARARERLKRAGALAETDEERQRIALFSKTFRLSECLFGIAAASPVSAAAVEAAKRHAREAIVPDPMTLHPRYRTPEALDAAIQAAIGGKKVE